MTLKVSHIQNMNCEPRPLPDPINVTVLSVREFDDEFVLVNGGYLVRIEEYNSQVLEKHND